MGHAALYLRENERVSPLGFESPDEDLILAQSDNENNEDKEKPETDSNAAGGPGMPNPAMSRLMKMQSRFVTEEALHYTEEQAKPKPKEPEIIEGELEDDFDDEGDYEDDEGDYEDDDFEDDDYEEPVVEEQAATMAANEQPAEEPEQEPEDESDHRVAQLRKFRQQFVSDKDLEVSATQTDETVYREVEVAKVLCPNCQAEQPRTDKICSNCGAKLPNITAIEEEKYNPGTMNSAVMKYVNAVKLLKEGKSSIDEFEDFLHEREQLSQTHIDGIIEIVEESGASEWLPDVTKLLLDSTGMLEDAIANMIIKVETARDQQPMLEADYDAQLADYEAILDAGEEDPGDPPMPPQPLVKRIKDMDFDPELNEIKKSNDLLLETLKMIDKFQREGDEDIEVSL